MGDVVALLRSGRFLGLLLVLLLAAGLLLVRQESATPPKTVTAHFSRAVSVYVGTDVRILGVNVGKVTAVTPEGESVRVDMEYDGQYDVPADAEAVVVTPTLVADRFVQLTPVFRDGDDVMADGADIALPDTAVPVELDRIYSSLQDLTRTLGPNGLNKDGTLNHVVEAGADALDGQGARLNQMLNDLAAASGTFADGSGDLFQTVTQLADLSTTLAANDKVVRAFVEDLAGVSSQLSGERQELRALLGEVARSVGTVRSFVKRNREALVGDVQELSQVLRVIASERDSLDTALSVAPAAIDNLVLAFDSKSSSVGSRLGLDGNIADADGLLCAFVQQSSLPKVSKTLACNLLTKLLTPLEEQAGGTGGGGGGGGLPLPQLPIVNNRPGTGSGAASPAPAPAPTADDAEPASLTDLLAGSLP